ncbi:nuclear transport factor 2 family protein [Shimazuella kribbensis]|uniref:nuclear transport factor 2 family protein n=1 Tax=Shimazuella kribbensis TaxID=139808 RepID=UPI000426DBCA|nr:nuclear transport factor 2 family protein [Shimazuella kribbensis]
MDNVIIGKGKLAGKGVYAAKDFEKGELVVPYNLKELSQSEFDALSHSEREWTHSFWGKIYLFSEPARYVNHDDNPSTFPDLDRRGNYALRKIKKGEAITIDDTIELRHELDTFLEAYEIAVNSRDFSKIEPLIADYATFWFANDEYSGKSDIKKACEDIWSKIQNEAYIISNVQWIASNYWVSACTYRFKYSGKRQVYEGHGTNVLRRIDGSWRIVHEHLSM